MRPEPPALRTVLAAAGVALCAGLTLLLVLGGTPAQPALRAIELFAALVTAVAALVAVIAFISSRLADWRDPASEEEFELLVRRSERLAREGLWAEPDEGEFLELDPMHDEDFEELVRDALDDLPDLLQNALRHVVVVISDKGRRQGAYGLYQGGQRQRSDTHDRIIVFRDTLRRDFGHDADAARQVTRTVRHELAHHVGFDEMGVRGLGL